jgi:type IV pilus assembly protein PilE
MSKQRGFSLIELMVVVLIIGILASVAINSYRKYVLRSHRTEAISALQDIAGRQERWFYTNNAYTTDLTKLNLTATVGNPNYAVTIPSATSTAYAITATALGQQLAGDKECQSFTLNSIGTQTSTGTAAAGTCWGR